MKLNKITFIYWLLFSLTGLCSLPAINIITKGWLSVYQEKTDFFTTDVIESYINYALYKMGISAQHNKTIVGKEDWLFLGDDYEQIIQKLRKTTSTNFSDSKIKKTIRQLKLKQESYSKNGITSLFVIVPNKHSVYPEKLPLWLELATSNSTDVFIQQAKEYQLNLLDLKKFLLLEKKQTPDLYFKTDTHWNSLAGYIGYQETLSRLNQLSNKKLNYIAEIKKQPSPICCGDLAKFLKIENFIESDFNSTFNIEFTGNQQEICLHKIDKNNLSIQKQCQTSVNHNIKGRELPALVTNDKALNQKSLLWLRDSFGNMNSVFFQATFNKIWMFHHTQLGGGRLQAFINQHHPDMLVYQIAERSILRESF